MSTTGFPGPGCTLLPKNIMSTPPPPPPPPSPGWTLDTCNLILLSASSAILSTFLNKLLTPAHHPFWYPQKDNNGEQSALTPKASWQLSVRIKQNIQNILLNKMWNSKDQLTDCVFYCQWTLAGQTYPSDIWQRNVCKLSTYREEHSWLLTVTILVKIFCVAKAHIPMVNNILGTVLQLFPGPYFPTLSSILWFFGEAH